MISVPATLRKFIAGRPGGFGMQGISLIAVRIAGAALGLAAQVLAARFVGPEAFGYYALILVWLLLLGHGSTAGTSQLICRFLAAYRVEGDAAAAVGLLRFAFMMAGGLALAVTTAALLVIRFDLLGLSPELIILASFAFAAIPLLVLQDFLEAISRGLDRPVLGIAPSFLLRHAAMIVGVAALMAVGHHGDAVTIMALTIAGLLASVAVQYALVRRPLRALLGPARPSWRVRHWFRTALPIALVDALEVLFANADILILGLFVSPEIVAFYFAATRLAQILGYVPYGISAATAQKYSSLAARGRNDELQDLVGSVSTLSTTLAVGAGSLLWIFAVPLLTLFGDGYENAAHVIPILCLGIVLVCAFGPGEDVLSMLGEERACLAVFGIALGVNLALNFMLIPAMGMVGAALASMIALGLRGILLAWVARRRLGINLPVNLGALAPLRRKEAR